MYTCKETRAKRKNIPTMNSKRKGMLITKAMLWLRKQKRTPK